MSVLATRTDLHQSILELIQKVCANKTVITVYHDAIESFDHQIPITKSFGTR